MLYPVWSLQDRIGEVRWEQIGLYWVYDAKLHGTFSAFVRLYLHTGESRYALGVFVPEKGTQMLNGRISARRIRNLGRDFVFSILPQPFLPPAAQPEPSPLPFSARRTSDGWEYCIAAEEINERVLPYFCFFRCTEIDNRSCVLLTQDRKGRPYLPEISP